MNGVAKSAESRPPWPSVFSFAPAIQRPAMEIWRDHDVHVVAAQRPLAHRARCNLAALYGDGTAATEQT
jgi:fructose-bisphosphate aldolase class I